MHVLKNLSWFKIVVSLYLLWGLGLCDLLAATMPLCVLQLARVLPGLSLLGLP
jgi:hypothetical protein